MASCLYEGDGQKVRPALNCTSLVLCRYIGDVWECVPLRAANIGAGVVGAGFGLRCLMSSPVTVLRDGRLGLRVRCSRWPRSDKRSFLGMGWIVLDSVHASWKSLIESSVSALAAAAAVAGLGMVAAKMSRMAGVIRPEADCRRRPSSACGASGACPKALSVISNQAGWSGMEVCWGWASIIAVRASAGWKVDGDFVVFLRFVEHQLANASWC